MFLLYPFLALGSLIMTVLSMLIFNWIVVLFVDSKGNLPWWCSYFQTFDAPLPVGYRAGVAWLMRNPSYGFDLFFFGTKWSASNWTVRKFTVSTMADLFIATDSSGNFNFYYQGNWSRKSIGGTYKFGWKAWNNFTDGKFNSNFGGGGNIPICITLNPFKQKV